MKRFFYIVAIIFCCLSLTNCVAPAMLLAPQSQLMWALLKPMVGLDPKETNLFRQPLIQSRLEPLLGSHYASAVQLLETADKIQQEGPLLYVVSKYTPVPELAEKAGFVWNSETNQMAVLLVSGGAPQIFAEKLNSEIAEQVPVWPKELSDYTDPAKLKQQALSQAKQQIAEAIPVDSALAPVAAQVEQVKNLKEQSQQQLQQTQNAVAAQILSPAQQVKNQLEQKTEQLERQAVETVTAPLTTAQQQLQQANSALQQPIEQLKRSEQTLQNSKDNASQQLQTVIPAAEHAQSSLDNAEDADLAAELAAEQQSLSHNVALRAKQLQQDIDATKQKLSQANNAADALALQQKLQKLQDELKQLTSGQ